MLNAILKWSLAYLLLPGVILAGPNSTAFLSPYLTDVVPTCAHRCLQSYIADNFQSPSCRQEQNLDCLCISNSASGLTLGEAALSCAASSCSESVLEASVNVYELCAQVQNARLMTHGTLTATQVVATTNILTFHSSTTSLPHSIGLPFSSPSGVTPSKSARSSSLPTAITTATTSSTPSTSSQPSTLSASRTTTQTTSTPFPSSSSSPITFIASPASSSAVPKPPATLTRPQIAGVTVAGVASAALAFGVLFCLFCIRRKDKKKRNSESSFIGDKTFHGRPGSSGPSRDGAADLEHGNATYTHGGAQARHGTSSENNASRFSIWRDRTRPEEIGVAVMGPRTMPATPPTKYTPSHDEALASASSFRTTSQLLPEKPIYSLFPQPLRVVNSSVSPISPQSPDSAETRFADVAVAGPSGKPAPRGRNAIDTSQRSLQQLPKAVRPPTADPFLDSNSGSSRSTVFGHRTGVGPSIMTRSSETIRKPVPVYGPPSAEYIQPSANRSKPSLQHPSMYVGRPTYGSAEQIGPTLQDRGASAAKRRNSFVRPATHYSTASDTSFEDAGEDDEITTAHPFLSPVAESPRGRSPPRPVRYPKIPGRIPPLNPRCPSPDSPTRRPPPKNAKRAIVAQATTAKHAKIPQPQVAELYGSPVSPKAGWNQFPSQESLRNIQGPSSESLIESVNGRRDSNAPSAKWQILVKPGLDGIDGASSSKDRPTPSPRSAKTGESKVSDRSGEWTPVLTPTKRGEDLRLFVR